jgi:hypothetical protein
MTFSRVVHALEGPEKRYAHEPSDGGDDQSPDWQQDQRRNLHHAGLRSAISEPSARFVRDRRGIAKALENASDVVRAAAIRARFSYVPTDLVQQLAPAVSRKVRELASQLP